MHDPLAPHPETPLGDLLPPRVKIVLEKNGIHTVEGVQRAYPIRLLKMHGMGMLRFKQIEVVLFPGKSYTPERVSSPIRHINGSSLNGVLSPGTIRVLAGGGVTTIEKLAAMEPEQLLKIHGLGVGKLQEIERVFLMGQRHEL